MRLLSFKLGDRQANAVLEAINYALADGEQIALDPTRKRMVQAAAKRIINTQGTHIPYLTQSGQVRKRRRPD